MMNHIHRSILTIFLLLSCLLAYAESSYDISEFYSVIKPTSGTKAVGRYDKVVDVEYILSPTKVDKGKYVVEVKKIGDNLYQIKILTYVLKPAIVTNGHHSQRKLF